MRTILSLSIILLIAYFALKHMQSLCIENSSIKTGNFLLVIAHPDDEVMFFTPLLQHLGKQISILCLSDGSYYNQGDLRVIEMQNICKQYNIPCVISKQFSDGCDWNANEIKNYIYNLHVINNFKAIFTFDKLGVSGHKNHKSCYYGVKEFIESVPIPVYMLKSQNLLYKYVFKFKFNDNIILKAKNWYSGVNLMMQYKSQLIWYRYLYLVTSNYMLYNEFVQYSR